MTTYDVDWGSPNKKTLSVSDITHDRINWPKGHVFKSWCRGPHKVGSVADGVGGKHEATIQEFCEDCILLTDQVLGHERTRGRLLTEEFERINHGLTKNVLTTEQLAQVRTALRFAAGWCGPIVINQKVSKIDGAYYLTPAKQKLTFKQVLAWKLFSVVPALVTDVDAGILSDTLRNLNKVK